VVTVNENRERLEFKTTDGPITVTLTRRTSHKTLAVIHAPRCVRIERRPLEVKQNDA
jgi:hypothetical protein